eukprot:TRINITY_DN6291_c0_g1_i3.p1 TRINITY_DN6291_c0_g1~~TRINITY_DN6291_c0_g1_i3.p1  ORF type:complete len:122 (+),score=27.26 TRINITY_DN6291_c0_g1_i3:164-529(+)
MSKLLVLCVLASLCLSAEAYSYGLTRFGPYGYPRSSSYVFNSLNWPGVKGPGFESTCWGCRGKRSADADPAAEPGYLGYGYGGYGYGLPTLGYGYGLPRVTGYSYEQRSPQGLKGYRAYLG